MSFEMSSYRRQRRELARRSELDDLLDVLAEHAPDPPVVARDSHVDVARADNELPTQESSPAVETSTVRAELAACSSYKERVVR